jgi:uncharacterized protein involved in exopolysaccharide biosynthesis
MSDNAGPGSIEIIQAIAPKWRRLAAGVLVAGVVSASGSMLLPKTYSSEASILPVLSNPGGFVLDGSSPAMTYVGMLSGALPQSELFTEILGSRTAREGAIHALDLYREFGLEELPERTRREVALRKLARMTRVSKTRAGIVRVRVKARTETFSVFRSGEDERARMLAARIANALVEQLVSIVREKGTSRARASRMFIEQKLEETKRALAEASDSLRVFQERNMAVSLDAQTEAMVTQIADVKGRIMAKDVEIEVLRRTMTPDNPEIRKRESERQALLSQSQSLIYGGADPGEENGAYLALQNIPAVAQEYADRLRRLKVQEPVFELLNRMYYETRIEEAGEVPLIQVLDEAVPAVRKDAPRRSLIVLAAMALTLIVLATREALAHGGRKLRVAESP